MNINEIGGSVLKELMDTVENVDRGQLEEMVEAILHAKRVFVAGAGRSLLMMRAFAMRLMHMGLTSYVVGETVTPAIGPDDLLIIGSGSGETGALTVMARKAQKIGSSIGLFTIYPESTIGQLATHIVAIDAATTNGSRASKKSVQPGANTFEQSLLILGDSIVIEIIERLGIAEENKVLMTRHANLE